MAKEICISSTPHETRLAIVEDDQLAEIYYERENEYTLAGSIYKGRVTRVLPGMQSAFVDVGLERDAFLYVTDFLEEQEDSADFERLGEQRPAAEGKTRREGGQPQREARPRQQQESGEAIPVSAQEPTTGRRRVALRHPQMARTPWTPPGRTARSADARGRDAGHRVS